MLSLSDTQKQLVLTEIIDFFQAERGEEIGVIAAGEVLDFFADRIAPHVYNQALTDAKKVFEERMADVMVDLDVLRRQ